MTRDVAESGHWELAVLKVVELRDERTDIAWSRRIVSSDIVGRVLCISPFQIRVTCPFSKRASEIKMETFCCHKVGAQISCPEFNLGNSSLLVVEARLEVNGGRLVVDQP